MKLTKRRHELWDRESGIPVLRCADCMRVRPNVLGAAVPAYHRTQDANHPAIPDSSPTGIERASTERREQEAEQRRVFALYERQCAGERVRRRFEQRG